MLLLVFCALLGTSFSVFLKGKGGKGSTAALWSVLLLSPWWFLLLVVSAGILSLLARITIQVKKLKILFIPCVIHPVERDVLFTGFGLLTSLLFAYNIYYHIGVLKVLEELRVPIHCVTGTSMGAIVGALYASGLSAV